MIVIKDIIRELEDFAPLHLQESYDNAGLILGDENRICSGAIICLDVLESVVDEAIENNFNLIIAHHPIIFTGLKKINGKNYVEKILIKAIQNNIALYASHTNLDNVLQGVNSKIAEKLSLKNLKILKPKNENEPNIGSGLVGALDIEMDEIDFLRLIKSKMKSKVIRHSPLLGKKIKKVAICGGSGSFLLADAIKQKADIFISSDFKYHQFFDANNLILIADIGHYETEQFTIEIFNEIITKKFPNFALRFTEINTNSINYF